MISAIYTRCDENDIHTGKPKLLTVPHATYNNAQKMQAAISHKFGCDYGLGTQPWMENPAYPGRFIGNPSLSVVVSQYMISLQHRKIGVYGIFDMTKIHSNLTSRFM
jgi:hypothetical protein